MLTIDILTLSDKKNSDRDYKGIIDILLIIRFIAQICLDGYLEPLLLRLILFFISKKVETLKH